MSSTSLSRPDVPGRAEIAANRRRAIALALLPAIVVFVVCAAVVGAVVSVLVGIIVGVVAGLAVGLGVWSSGPVVVFRLTRARVAGIDEQPRVHNLVDALCAASGIPKPMIRVVDDDSPDAMTVGLHPRRATIVITSGLVSAMGRIELEAVLAHEVSHVKVHDILPGTVAATALGPVAALIPPAGGLPSWGAGRNREALADLAGVALTRYPPGLISALEKVGGGSREPGQRQRARDRVVDHLWIFGRESSLDERLLALQEL